MKLFYRNIDSSAITSLAWDPDYDILYVYFPTGSSWIYHSVDYDKYNALITAISVGSFFNTQIRNNSQHFAQKASATKEKSHTHA